VAGESAGGHLSSMIALTGNFPKFQPEECPEEDTSVQLCIDIYGVHDFVKEDRDKSDKNRAKMMQFLCENIVMQVSLKNDENLFRDASPTSVVKRMIQARVDGEEDTGAQNIPPTLLIHGDKDSLASLVETRDYYAVLQKLRKTVKSSTKDVLAEVPGGHHGFGYIKTPRSIATAGAIASFMHHHFGSVMTESRL